MTDYSVLIVGAGPTGMALAAELHRYGVDFLIIDKRPDPVTTSNAAGIHARTLECWHRKPWMHSFIQDGLSVQHISINTKKKSLAQFDFSQLQYTQYPMILSIPQNQTESILDHYLTETHNAVQRSTTLVHLSENIDHVVAKLQTPDGEKSVTAEWVVGCDGYHSTVRDFAKIEFSGSDVAERFLLIDAVLDADYEKKAFHVYLDPKGILAFFTMRHSTRIIAGISHDPTLKDIKEPSHEVIKQIIEERTSLTFKLGPLQWQSHFWIHERIAKKFKSGRLFICGDAAHVHSPAGGQGMNTGIQDAYNLAWKLAYVRKRGAHRLLLEEYHTERHQIAESVVDITAKMTRLANLHHPVSVAFRNFFMPFLTQCRVIQKTMLGRMSELALSYQKNAFIYGRTIAGISPGERARDTQMDDNLFLFDQFNDTKHHLLVFHANEEQKRKLNEFQKRYESVLSLYDDAQTHTTLLKAYPFKQFTLCLVRPDQYIGYLNDDLDGFQRYFSEMFL